MTQPSCGVSPIGGSGIEGLLRRHCLDASKKTPLYVQLSKFLRDSIRAGSLMPGTRLPPEKELQHLFQVSRITVRQALDSLVREGRIRRRRGLGTEILAPRQDVVLDRRMGLDEALRALGRSVYRHRLTQEVVAAPSAVAEFLGVPQGQPVLSRVSVLFVDGDRVACSDLFRARSPSADGTGWEDQGGVRPDARHQTVEVIPAHHSVADHLQIQEGTPVLCHVLGLYRAGNPVERQEHHYRSDSYRYRFRM